MTQVFISYSRNDMDFVQRLAMDLNHSGLDVWWDLSDIQGSDVWERKIEEGLTTSQYFIVVLSPASLESRWVRREYLSADKSGIKIIPLRLKSIDEMPLTLRDVQPIEAVGRAYDDVLSDVLRILRVESKTRSVKDGEMHGLSTATFQKNVARKGATVPEKESLHPILRLLLAKGIRGVDIGGTFPLATFFLLAGLELLGPGDDAVKVLMAASAVLAGIFLLLKNPETSVFKLLGIVFLLAYAATNYSEDQGAGIPYVSVIAGISALLAGGIMLVTIQRPRKPVYFSAFSFALMLFIVALKQYADYNGDYDVLREVPIMYTSVITAILLWRDL